MAGRAAMLRLVPTPAPTLRRANALPAPAVPVPRLWPTISAGLLVLAVLIAGGMVWVQRAQISGAVSVPGRVEAGLGPFPVRSLENGFVDAVFVADGDAVVAGTALVRLSAVDAQAELAQLDTQIATALAQALRLRWHLAPGFTATGQMDDLAPGSQLDDPLQRALFAAENALSAGVTQALADARATHEALDQALSRQRVAVRRQADLIAEELATQTRLLDQGLAQAGRSLALQREAARLAGVLAEIDAQALRMRQTLSEAEIAHARTVAERERFMAEALVQAEAQLRSARALRPALEERLARRILRAPEDAIVQDMSARPGTMLAAGEPALWLVPRAPLQIVAQLPDTLAGTVLRGQELRLLLPPGTTDQPDELAGQVVSVAEQARGRAPGQPPTYTVVIALLSEAHSRRLVPGMPVEVLVPQPARRPVDMLLAPWRSVFPDTTNFKAATSQEAGLSAASNLR